MNYAEALEYHDWMLSDAGRLGGYEAAIRAVVRPGDVVVDIGTGTGILAFLACRAGARKVYGMESSPIVEVARGISAANGMADRIEFFQGMSYDLAVPETADVLITDTGGALGLNGSMLGAILDARFRFLKPGARIIPSRLDLWMAPVECPGGHAMLDRWQADRCGFDFKPARAIAANSVYVRPDLEANCLLAVPQLLARLVLAEAETPLVGGRVQYEVSRNGVFHGIAGWQATELAPGIGFTNSPIAPTVKWSRGFLPIEHPVAVQAGDRLAATINTYGGGEWQWQVEVRNSAGEPKAAYSHSTNPEG